MNPGARTQVNDMISAADGLFVMLDHHHRVAEVAEVKQGIQQALVVTLMKPDGGFVQDIHHADQSRADLRGEPDTLSFSARQCFGSAIQRQIFQADVDQKAQSLTDFADDTFADLALISRQGERFEEVERGLNRHRGQSMHRLIANEHVPRAGFQTAPVAAFTGLGVEISGQFFTNRVGF